MSKKVKFTKKNTLFLLIMLLAAACKDQSDSAKTSDVATAFDFASLQVAIDSGNVIRVEEFMKNCKCSDFKFDTAFEVLGCGRDIYALGTIYTIGTDRKKNRPLHACI